jgi:SulP family sulfate permease
LGIPGAGATKGTVVNINAGGKTRISGAIHGLFLLAVLLGLGSLAAYIPIRFGRLLIPIGFKIIDVKGLKHLLRVPRADAAVLILVLITTFGNLIQAVGLGVALASILFMKRQVTWAKRHHNRICRKLERRKPWQDELPFYDEYKDKVLIKHLKGPLFFDLQRISKKVATIDKRLKS